MRCIVGNSASNTSRNEGVFIVFTTSAMHEHRRSLHGMPSVTEMYDDMNAIERGVHHPLHPSTATTASVKARPMQHPDLETACRCEREL
jgi:hypothetical protein